MSWLCATISFRRVKWLDSIARRLLLASERHSIVGPVGLGLAVFLAAQVVLFAFFGGLPHDPLGAVVLELLVLITGVTIPLILVMIAFRKAFQKVLVISRTATPRAREFLIDHLGRTLDGMHEQLKSLQSGTGLSLAVADLEEVGGWIPTFFSQAQGVYVGFDATTPSEYVRRWRPYLHYLDQYKPGVRLRVVTASTEDLESDLVAHPEAASQLQAMHDAWGARLLCMDGDAVRELAEGLRLPSSLVDLAFWEGDYCLLWERGTDRFTVRLCYAGEPTYERVSMLIHAVERAARPLAELHPSGPRAP